MDFHHASCFQSSSVLTTRLFLQSREQWLRRRQRECRARLPAGGDGSSSANTSQILFPLAAALLPGGLHHGGEERAKASVASDGRGEVQYGAGLVNAALALSERHDTFASSVCSEMNGSCVGNVRLSGPVTVQSEGVFLHRFQRTTFGSQQVSGSSGLASGDRIVVSDQEGRLVGLATGYTCEVGRSSVCCTLDR